MRLATVVGAVAIAALVTGAQAEDLGAPFAAIMKRLHKIDSQQQAISDNMESVRANRAQDMVHSTVSSMLDHEDAQDRKAMTSAAVGRIKAELAGAPESAATHRGLRFASRSQARLQDKKEKMLSPEVDSDCGEEIGEGSGSGSLEDKVQEAVDDAVGHTDEDLGTSQEMEDTAEEANAVKKEEEEAEQQIEEAEQAAGAVNNEVKQVESEAAKVEAENKKKKEEIASLMKNTGSEISERSQSQSHLHQVLESSTK